MPAAVPLTPRHAIAGWRQAAALGDGGGGPGALRCQHVEGHGVCPWAAAISTRRAAASTSNCVRNPGLASCAMSGAHSLPMLQQPVALP